MGVCLEVFLSIFESIICVFQQIILIKGVELTIFTHAK